MRKTPLAFAREWRGATADANTRESMPFSAYDSDARGALSPGRTPKAATRPPPPARKMRIDALLLTAVISLLAGCGHTPFPVLDTKLDALKGKPIKTVTDVLGNPDQVSQVGDEKSYLWSLTKQFGGASNIVAARCDITVFTGTNGTITHYAYSGNDVGCSRYALKLDSTYHYVQGILD